jgi:hypothetical protein
MSKYDTFQFTAGLPEAMTPSGSFIVENGYYGKQAAVIVVNELDPTAEPELLSTHERLDLADRRASKESREAGRAGVPKEFLPVELKLVPREKTYFDEDGSYGNANELLVLDTSTWTPEMWARLQWTGMFRKKLAVHFDSKLHTFETMEWRDYSGPAGATKTITRCTECMVVDTNLNL